MQANDSMVELDGVRYGSRGPFAINLWMRAQSLNGALFEYLYSHNSTATDPSGWGPNQVRRLCFSGVTGMQLARSTHTCMPVFLCGLHLFLRVGNLLATGTTGKQIWMQLPIACSSWTPCFIPDRLAYAPHTCMQMVDACSVPNIEQSLFCRSTSTSRRLATRRLALSAPS